MAEQNNKTKRQLQGVVVSDKMEKTITVQVSTYKAGFLVLPKCG